MRNSTGEARSSFVHENNQEFYVYYMFLSNNRFVINFITLISLEYKNKQLDI